MAEVDVILRTFERPDMLRRAVASVLAQTFEDFQIIIVDDQSGDDTTEVCAELVRSDNRISYHRTATNLKLSGRTNNFGVSKCTAPIVTFLDDDDWWEPEKLQFQMEALKTASENCALVTCGQRDIDADTGKVLKKVTREHEGDVYWESLGASGHIYGPPSAVMIPAAVLKQTGVFSEEIPRGACQHMFRRVAKNRAIRTVQKPLLNYTVHLNSITGYSSIEKIQQDVDARRIKIRDFHQDLQRVPVTLANELQRLAKLSLASGDWENWIWAINQLHSLPSEVRQSVNVITFIGKRKSLFRAASPVAARHLMGQGR